jgi:hypothetical protein
MAFARDFALVAGRKGFALVSLLTLVPPVVVFLLGASLWVAVAVALAALLVASVLAAHHYWSRLQATQYGLDLAISLGRVHVFEPRTR